jgi:hypothetical protein
VTSHQRANVGGDLRDESNARSIAYGQFAPSRQSQRVQFPLPRLQAAGKEYRLEMFKS